MDSTTQFSIDEAYYWVSGLWFWFPGHDCTQAALANGYPARSHFWNT